MLNINTNLSSLIAQNSLKQSTNKLNTAIERMSTGCKINHASDNAANYSISTNMTTKIGAYQVAEDNALQGLDMINTASESLMLIEDKLMRLRALAEQAANGTYGAQSKQAINQEANAIVDEIERLYNTTEYNGIKLFDQADDPNIPKAQYDGFIKEVVKRDTTPMTTLASVDPNTDLTDGTYSIATPEEMKKLADMTDAGLVSAGDEFVLANDIDLSQYYDWNPIGDSTNKFLGTFDGNGFEVKNLRINAPTGGNRGLFSYIKNSLIKNLGVTNCDVFASSSCGIIAAESSSSVIDNCYTTGVGTVKYSMSGIVGNLRSSTISNCYSSTKLSGIDGSSGLVQFANGTSTITNCYFDGAVTGTTSAGILGHLGGTNVKILNTNVLMSSENLSGVFVGKFTSSTQEITIQDCSYDSKNDNYGINICGGTVPATLNVNNVTAFDSAKNPLKLQVGINSEEASFLKFAFEDFLDGVQMCRTIGIVRSGVSYDYQSLIDNLFKKVNEAQVLNGAMQNRLESVVEEIGIQYDNLVSSRSTLRDADIAEVSAEYIQQQILQQASATLLSTANQSPSIALQLI